MLHTVQTIGERVGLAAPQVGILKRVIVFRIPAKPVNPRYASTIDPTQEENSTVLLNNCPLRGSIDVAQSEANSSQWQSGSGQKWTLAQMESTLATSEGGQCPLNAM